MIGSPNRRTAEEEEGQSGRRTAARCTRSVRAPHCCQMYQAS